MLAFALALPFLFSADRVLLDGLRADDHRVRIRAAYALAREYDPGDTTETTQVARLVRQGDASEAQMRPAAIRGLFAHPWPGDPPSDVRAWMEALLDDPDPAIVREALAGWATMPGDLALEPLRKRMHASGAPAFPCAFTLARLDDPEARKWLLSQPRWRDGMSPLRREACVPDLASCLDELATRRWLGQTDDVDAVAGRFRKSALTEPTYVEKQMLDRLAAAGGDTGAADRLASLAQQAADVETRLRVLGWLLELPRYPRPELEAVLAHGAADPDANVRAVAVPAYSRIVMRFGHRTEAAGYLASALIDRNPDVRLEAALALADLKAAPPAAALADEDDPIVKDALRRAMP